MKRLRMAGLAALGLVGLFAAGEARAQYGYQHPATNPYNPPAVSPYLNLLRPGTPPGINYSTLVRPQIETGKAIQQLQYQVTQEQILMGQLREAPTGFDPTAALPFTGHPTKFMTYSHYFTTTAARQGSTPGLGAHR